MTNDSQAERRSSSYPVFVAAINGGSMRSTTYSVVGVRHDKSRVTIVHGVSFTVAERAMKLIVAGPEYKNICVEEESPATLALSTAVSAANPKRKLGRRGWIKSR